MAQDFRAGLNPVDDVRSALVDFAARRQTFLLSDEHRHLTRAVSGIRAATRAQLHTIYRNGPQATVDGLNAGLASQHAAGVIECPAPGRTATLLLGMLQGMDLVRSLYRVEVARGEGNVRSHRACMPRSVLR